MNQGIYIVSLNSQKLREALKYKEAFELNQSDQELHVFVFDSMEVLNGIFFNNRHVGEQQKINEDIIEALETDFIGPASQKPQKRLLVRETQSQLRLEPFMVAVTEEYSSNGAFRKHCKNQIFRNLQPKLRRVGIEKNNSPLLELLAPFLLTEIALFLSIYDYGDYQFIYGLEREMDIVRAIRENKYEAFNAFLKHDVKYQQINLRDDASIERHKI